MDGKYIYGVKNTSEETILNIAGVGGSGPVHTIACQGLAGVVSDYSGRDFGSMPKEEMVRSLLAHQVVVEHIMRDCTVLPVKFGTILASSEEVRGILTEGHSQFAAALSWIQDKVEVEVAATWDTERVLREISAEPEIVRQKEAIASRPGQPTQEERIRLGQMVKASMDRLRDSYGVRMMGFLGPAAVEVQPNALISEEMVMNVAFLVEKAGQEEFERRLRELNGLFHDQVNFRVIGPLPPYSFASVEVTKPRREEIEEARKLLSLGKVTSEPEVRRAYRRLAAETHPDRKPGDELAKTRFAKLRQARDLLMAYCRGQGESEGNWLIHLRRRRDEEVRHFTELAGV